MLNPHLNYKRNNYQGALIRGDHMLESVKPNMVNYVVFYAEYCFNAKRQARTTVDLYNKYADRVHFVVVDFNYGWSAIQNKLVEKYFAMNVPQILILDPSGRPVFNYIGQVNEPTLEKWLNAALNYPQILAAANRPMDNPQEELDPESTRFRPVKKILKVF
ncbi:MAG: thioredoxin domain-containing protein [Terriglobia bacterium]